MVASEAFSIRARGARAVARVTPEALVLALAIPIIFWHLRYQPKIHIHVGSTLVGIELSDVAVLAVVGAAVAAGVRLGFSPLRRGRPIWLATGFLFVWIAIAVVWPAGSHGYPWQTHGVTAAKFFEYALLAPAVVLLVRNLADLGLLIGVVVAWSVVATFVGLIQFFGANIFVSGATGGRQLSFLGFHDFGALSAAALAVGLAAVALPALEVDRVVGWAGAISGALGVVLSAPITAVVGLGLAGLGLLVLALLRKEFSLRRFAALGAILAVTAAGAVAMRGDQLDEVLRFVGIEAARDSSTDVESYAHRSVLAWIGWQIFVDHPVVGVGWQASGDPERFMPYVPAARSEFPNEPELAFPAPDRRYGVQDLYVQVLADLGIVGFLLLLAVFGAVAWTALRSRNAFAVIGLVWAAVVAGVWAALGIVAGIPLDALTWIAFGLVAIVGAKDSPAGSGKVPLQ